MPETVQPQTGEVTDARDLELVPFNLAAMDEDALLALFPSEVQAAGALIKARQASSRVPAALNQRREELRSAERALTVQLGLAVRDLAAELPRATLTERRMIAATDPRVIAAQERRDDAWLLLEYTRDWERAIARDIDILRSLNANFRGERK